MRVHKFSAWKLLHEKKKIVRLLHVFKVDLVFSLDSGELFFETINSFPSYTARIQQNKFIIRILCADTYHLWNLDILHNIVVEGYVINLFQNPPQYVKRFICVLAATVWLCAVCLWEWLWRIDVLTGVINTVLAEKAAGSVFLNLASPGYA